MTNTLNDYCARCADSVAQLAAQFRREIGTDQEDVVCDMVCNLMHYAHRNGQDPVAEIERAIWHWYEQCNDRTIQTVKINIYDPTKQTTH